MAIPKPLFLSVPELATRWGQSERQIIEHAEALRIALYFRFDGVAVPLADVGLLRWNQAVSEGKTESGGLPLKHVLPKWALGMDDNALYAEIRKREYNGILRAAPDTLSLVREKGEIDAVQLAYMPGGPFSLTLIEGAYRLDGPMVRLEYRRALRPLTPADFLAFVADVEALESAASEPPARSTAHAARAQGTAFNFPSQGKLSVWDIACRCAGQNATDDKPTNETRDTLAELVRAIYDGKLWVEWPSGTGFDFITGFVPSAANARVRTDWHALDSITVRREAWERYSESQGLLSDAVPPVEAGATNAATVAIATDVEMGEIAPPPTAAPAMVPLGAVITNHLSGRTMKLEAEFEEARQRAPAPDNWQSAWSEFTKLAEERFGSLIGFSADGVQYRGTSHQDTGIPDAMSKRAFAAAWKRRYAKSH